ncbi:MAG: metallophosphoesterase [Chromatiales bacterium]|nr:metallophosphoesterase [Chromatiales bacterium]
MADSVPAALRPGPLDIVGDVHGELGALNALLNVLGYRDDGSHPDRRSLVFLGDLCDRGPDSPGVIRYVADLVAAGRAQCLLGNHELNLLRGSAKAANGWFFAEDHDRAGGKFLHSRQASAAEREAIPRFLASLPLALEREDLRVVHAAWHDASLASLQRQLPGRSVVQVYEEHHAAAERWAEGRRVRHEAEQEWQEWGQHLAEESVQVPLLAAMGTMDEQFQMSNPVRVPTSGVERLAKEPFFASGKWRMVDRVPWWHGYGDDVPVLFGHYWRWSSPAGAARYSRGERDLFAGVAHNEWLGPRRNAFCVDFSVGVRYRERAHHPGASFLGRLGAVRWPERELVYDDGERLPLVD